MKAIALFTCIAALLAAPQDKLTLSPSPKVGDKAALKVAITMTVDDGGIEVKAKFASKIASIEEGKIKVTGDYSEVAVILGDQDISSNVTLEPVAATLKADGDLLAYSGGLVQADGVRVFLLTQFVPPSKELAPGDKYAIEFKGNKEAMIPARKIEGVYVGVEEFAAKKAYKFTQKYSETEKDGMNSESTYWVDNAGNVLKLEGKFDKLPITQLGAIASGTMKGEKLD